MLTRKQYDLLIFVDEYLQKHGVSPSFDEIREALSLKSKSGIHRLIDALEERGFMRRLENRARALEVLRLPQNVRRDELPQRNRRSDKARRELLGSERTMIRNVGGMLAQLPLFGRIAAGTPIEALRDNSIMVEVPVTMLGKGDHYALEIKGDSMIDEGIMDGDTVVIERIDRAENGDIVVALIEDHEATLKRYEFEGSMIRLSPANRHYQAMELEPHKVKVQGRLVGLMRKY